MLSKENNTSYTIAVAAVIESICGQNNPNSLYAQAHSYFLHAPEKNAKINLIRQKIDELILKVEDLPKDKRLGMHTELRRLQKELKTERQTQKAERLVRLRPAIKACEELLALTEGEDYDETQLKSSKFLATVLMFSPGKGKQLAELHQTLVDIC